MVSESALNSLIAEMRACRVCRDTPNRLPPLPHEPNPIFQLDQNARVCIAGQAAGTRAHASTKPFNDPSGDRLRNWMGVGPDVFYDGSKIAIVPMGFCFPGLDEKGGDLPPRRECAPLWRDKVFAHLPRLELVLAVGQYAQKWHMGARRGKTLTETVRAWRALWETGKQPRIMPLPHPSWRNNAWLKKNPWFEAELLPVLRAEILRLL